jgi:hypothetical protein
MSTELELSRKIIDALINLKNYDPTDVNNILSAPTDSIALIEAKDAEPASYSYLLERVFIALDHYLDICRWELSNKEEKK